MMKHLAGALLLVTVVTALSACKPPAPAAPAAPAATAATAAPDYAAVLGPVVDKLISAYNTRDYSQIDSVLAADFQRTAPDKNLAGPAEMQALIDEFHRIYGDFRLTPSDRAFTKDLGFVHWAVTGNYIGDAGAAAAARPVRVTGITMYQFRDGKIVREVVYFDSAVLDAQIAPQQMPHAAG